MQFNKYTYIHTYIYTNQIRLSMEMNRLTRDGTAEAVSQETIFSGANGDREIFIFPVQLTTSTGLATLPG